MCEKERDFMNANGISTGKERLGYNRVNTCVRMLLGIIKKIIGVRRENGWTTRLRKVEGV